MQKHMTKGKMVGIEGKLNQNVWEDNSGAKHNDITIVVDNIALLLSPKGESNNTKPEKDPETGDNIPF
jgi:single-stranded DNA-binding protein